VSFDVAMGIAAPQVVLLDEPMRQVFADRSTPFARDRADRFWAFMNRRGARIVRELRDRAGALLQVYQLDP
jgi:hypothetical protein